MTHTRDSRLLVAAAHVEQLAAGLGSVLRHSHLEVWDEPDASFEDYSAAGVMDECIAQQYADLYARRVGRLTVKRDTGRTRRWSTTTT